VTRDADFARGLGGSWLALGGLEVIGAAFYVLQVGAEIDHYEGGLARDPAGYRAEEIEHIRGTSMRFAYYRAIELGLTLAGAGIAAYGLSARRDAWTGSGAGIGSLALPLLVIDAFNDARAARYLDEVRRFRPAVGLAESQATLCARSIHCGHLGPRGPAGGWLLSLGGSF
jgi:hypothetical protein